MTKIGIDYLNDMIARITITLKECKPERLLFKPNMKEPLAHYYPNIYRLFELQKAKSLTKKTHAPIRAEALDDFCFWAIKLYTEDAIRIYGEGTPVPYSQIEEWAFTQFIDYKKGRSTVRAKARSIWNWYDKHSWELPKGYVKKYNTKKELEDLIMTRQERAKSNAKARAEKARKAVINAITGLYADEYRKVNGKWHIGKISKATSITEKTVSKYLKQYEEEKLENSSNII